MCVTMVTDFKKRISNTMIVLLVVTDVSSTAAVVDGSVNANRWLYKVDQLVRSIRDWLHGNDQDTAFRKKEEDARGSDFSESAQMSREAACINNTRLMEDEDLDEEWRIRRKCMLVEDSRGRTIKDAGLLDYGDHVTEPVQPECDRLFYVVDHVSPPKQTDYGYINFLDVFKVRVIWLPWIVLGFILLFCASMVVVNFIFWTLSGAEDSTLGTDKPAETVDVTAPSDVDEKGGSRSTLTSRRSSSRVRRYTFTNMTPDACDKLKERCPDLIVVGRPSEDGFSTVTVMKVTPERSSKSSRSATYHPLPPRQCSDGNSSIRTIPTSSPRTGADIESIPSSRCSSCDVPENCNYATTCTSRTTTPSREMYY